MSSAYFFMTTLGCRVNQYESQAISEALQRQGLVPADGPEQAGYIYVNSCAVTARAVKDLKKTLRRLRVQAPQARIIVTGCAAQIFEEELGALEEVDLVVPQSRKTSILASPFPDPHAGDPGLDYWITSYFRARPVVKVQDGCSRGCSYCIVPASRGAPVSRPPEVVLREIQGLLNRGYREIVISGINLGMYGVDLDAREDFWDLICYLEKNLASEWEDRMRLRLSSLDPAMLDSRGIDIISSSVLICPHFHLSLQSGCTWVLTRMGRDHYHPAKAIFFVERLERTIPFYSMGADFLVGFPGEKPDYFERTLKLTEALPLSYGHVFTYSPRPGTRAARWPDQIAQHVKEKRARELKEVLKHKRQRFTSKLLREDKLRLIMETPYKGMSEYYMDCFIEDQNLGLKPGDTVSAAPYKIQDSKLMVEVFSQYW
ncbi:RNA modification enzyme, MiaB family [Desulfonatronospira thiodismutans ASO3-1]|uniref:RNA modification enzyme, MiaB family n=1 Tax=Desulfonatronospira thiodismutans ASO3-1 TaxID=555779 RepID=D6SMV8_9BACT|nr:MiaB/RimO family radical SAM methylthiotransferase [Desulfonatronospira thiodismutans]EFI36019.1 RNA modification enzyme, MiaB family [Desulfonatronospira thiodismutans ASO3-1]